MKKKLLLQDIVDYITQHEELNPDEAEGFVRAFFDTVEQGLQEDKIVKIKGLGTFKLVAVSERESVNINTGERFQIEGHSKISFTPDNSMKELINRPFAHFEAVELSDDTDAEEFNEIDKEVELEFENSDDDTDDEEDDSSELEDDDNVEEEKQPVEKTAPLSQDLSVSENMPESSDEPESASAIPFEIENTLHQEEVEEQEPISTESTIDMVTAESSDAETESDTSPQMPSIELDTQAPNDNLQIETGMQENRAGETPQPTTIAPTDLAATDEKRETAKIKIDSNDDESETVETPKAESVIKNNDDNNNNTETSEEEIVVTPPRPITSEHDSMHTSNTMGYAYVEVPSRKKVNWWKRGVLTFLFLLLLVISYFAGYYNVLCPCVLPGIDKETVESSQSESVQQTDRMKVEKKQDVAAQSEQTESVSDRQPDVTEEKASKTVSKEPASPKEPVKHEVDTESKAAQSSLKPAHKTDEENKTVVKKQPSEKKVQANDKESKTVRTHTVKVGDTLYKIARKYYGNEEAIHKIIKYNNLKDADNIQLGMTLKLP